MPRPKNGRASYWLYKTIGKRFRPVVGLERVLLERGTDGERWFERYVARDLQSPRSEGLVTLECFRGEDAGNAECWNPELAVVPERAARFLLRLDHPNIARVIASGSHGHDFFIARAHAHELSLSSWIDRREYPIFPETALYFTLCTCEALAAIAQATAAADEGRGKNGGLDDNVDLSNILVDEGGNVRLAVAATAPLLLPSPESYIDMPAVPKEEPAKPSAKEESAKRIAKERAAIERMESSAKRTSREREVLRVGRRMSVWLERCREKSTHNAGMTVPPEADALIERHVDKTTSARELADAIRAVMLDKLSEKPESVGSAVRHAMGDSRFTDTTGLPTLLEMGRLLARPDVPFMKYQGLGNDFIVVDDRWHGDTPSTPPDRCVALCDRRRGIGADGVISVLAPKSAGAVARMHITNADGSVPEMCGNGIRCLARFLVDMGTIDPHKEVLVDTDAGARKVMVIDNEDVRVDMGPASFDAPKQIPTWKQSEVTVDGITFTGSAVSMGNPHLVLDARPDVTLARCIGPHLERHRAFPDRTNVELATVRKDGSVDVIVWERGVGITEACGTGACAVAAVLARDGRVPYDEDVVIHLPGGELVIRVPKNGGSVIMTGPARRVFAGDVRLDEVGGVRS